MTQVIETPGLRLLDGADINALAGGQGYSTVAAVTAAGTTQATATQLQYNAITRIGTAASSTGVVMPSAQPGMWMMIANDGAQTVAVYGLGSDTINGTAGATGVTQVTTAAALYFCAIAGKWSRVLTA